MHNTIASGRVLSVPHAGQPGQTATLVPAAHRAPNAAPALRALHGQHACLTPRLQRLQLGRRRRAWRRWGSLGCSGGLEGFDGLIPWPARRERLQAGKTRVAEPGLSIPSFPGHGSMLESLLVPAATQLRRRQLVWSRQLIPTRKGEGLPSSMHDMNVPCSKRACIAGAPQQRLGLCLQPVNTGLLSLDSSQQPAASMRGSASKVWASAPAPKAAEPKACWIARASEKGRPGSARCSPVLPPPP